LKQCTRTKQNSRGPLQLRPSIYDFIECGLMTWYVILKLNCTGWCSVSGIQQQVREEEG
jgi:hypothetical protein